MDQGSNKNHSPAYNFAPTVTKFCVMWEGLSLPHDTKFGNCRCKIVDSRSFPSWSLIHGLRWSGLIKVGPACKKGVTDILPIWLSLPILYFLVSILQLWKILMAATHMMYVRNGIEFKVTSRLYEPYFKVHRRCVHYTKFHSGTFNIKTNIHISIMYSTQKNASTETFQFCTYAPRAFRLSMI